mmetsp:Transcript_14490/g.54718  ORF Transcript_14490/g.54718 Transcript_14490/m.54718 type:complete len:379 (-) Transcript_14490:695-1831(-)
MFLLYLATSVTGFAAIHAITLQSCRIISSEAVGWENFAKAGLHVLFTLASLGLVLGLRVDGLHIALTIANALLVAVAYETYVRGPAPPLVDMQGKVVFVTGANTGIGKETAKQLLERDATVVFACRSEPRARKAIEDCLRATGRPATRAVFVQLDLSNSKSVRDFCEKCKEMGLSPDVVVANAGLMQKDEIMTSESINLTLAANHYGHFLLTWLLLKDYGDFRLVVVSSALHQLVKSASNFKSVMEEKEPYSLFGYYSVSKLANVLMTRAAAQRMAGKNIAVALHPGNVMTEVTRNMPAWMQWGHFLIRPLLMTILKRPPMGAYTSVYAACAPLDDQVQGAYLVHCKPAPMNPLARDDDLAEWLWTESEKRLGLNKVK